MAKDWKTVMTPKQGAWNIPAVALTELDAFIHAAETALAAAKNETTRTPSPGLIFHSDRGMQYCSKSLRELMRLRCPAVRQSMSRKGNCWDKACAESFLKP
jgi:transposase InsO family protein